MIDEFKKSINNILYERVTSPFYGTFIISWLIWNWNIIYLTLFVSEKSLKVTKLEYINTYLIDYCKLLWLPLFSSSILILLVPFIANGAFYVSLKFTTWKKNQKQIIEGDVLLTKNESIALRQEILEQENRFSELLASKQKEIEQLKRLIENNDTKQNKTPLGEFEEIEISELVNKIKNNQNFTKYYKTILEFIQGGYQINPGEKFSSEFISLLVANGVIEKKGPTYIFTQKGLKFQKKMLD